MGSATKWLFSASISLAFVAGTGCIPANAQGENNVGLVRFNNNYESGYSGTVWGDRYTHPRQINLKVFSDSSENDFKGFTDLKSYWEVLDPDGEKLTQSTKLDLDTFENLSLEPTLQFYGDWSEAYKDVFSEDISLAGDIYKSKDAFSPTGRSYFYENIPIVCDGNVDCGKWQLANPEGVKVEIAPAEGDLVGTFSIYAINPNSIEDIDQGADGSCFERDGRGVKVPTAETCTTDEEKFSGKYTSLKVEDNGTLRLGGNLILDKGFTSFQVQDEALVEGSGGLVKTGPQTTVLKGTGTFAYEGDVFVQGGVLEITNATGLGSTDAGTKVEKGAILRISVDGESTPQGSPTKDAQINEEITLAGGELDLNGNYIDLKGGVVLEGKDVNSTIRVKDGSTEVFARSIISGKGGLIKEGKGFLRLGGRGPQTYEGETIIEAGELRFAETTSTPDTTDVTVREGATLRLMGAGNKIQSLSGSGRLILQNEISILTSGLSGKDDEFSGVISGDGGFTKVGKGTTTLSGYNTFKGATTIENGTLKLGDANSLSKTSQITLGSYLYGCGGKECNPDGFGVFDLGALDVSTNSFEVKNGSLQGGGQLTVLEKMPETTHHSQFILGEGTELILMRGGRIDPKISLNGLISIKGGNLILLNSQADGEGSISVDSGATLQVSNNSGYRGLLSDWNVDNNGTLRFQKAPSQDVAGDISGVGNVIINAVYQQTNKIITFSGKNTYTGNTTVNSGALLAGADGTFSKSSELIANEGGVIDLGGFNQSVGKISIKGGELKNGFLSGGTVEVFGTGFIDGVGVVAEESESESESKLETDPEVEAIVISPGSASLIANGLESGDYLTLTGDNHFKDLKLESGKVLLGSLNNKLTSKSGSLVLDGGVTGSAFGDAFVLQGALTLDEEQTIDLGGGDDLFFIGAKGSLIAAPLVEVEVEAEVDPAEAEAEKEEIKKLKITIDGGAGDMDIFWDASGNYYSLTESADGLFTESEDSQLAGNVKNFELVGVAGQGIAYFGTTPSFATVQAEASPPPGEYGLMLGSVGKDESLIGGVDQKLTINSGYDSGTSDSLITKVGGIALGKGDATIVVPGGTLEAGIIYGVGDKSTIELGSAFTGEVKLGALSSVAKGRLDVGVLYGYDTINQLGGLWSYNGRMDETNLLAQGVVRVEADDSATFKSITARERRQKINTPLGINGRSIIAVSGALTIGEGGIQEQGSARASLLVASRDGADAHVNLYGKSNYSGPTIVARGATLHALNEGALSPVSKTFIGREASIDITGAQDIYRLVIRDQGSMTGDSGSSVVSQSIVNRGDINLDSIQLEDGMTRFLDRVIERRGVQIPVDSPLRKIKAQGSLKNLGGSIELTGDLTFESTGDAGHALLNLSSREEEKLALIRAKSIELSDANDVLINTGVVETSGPQGIDFKGGNDLVLTKGTFDIAGGSLIDGGEPLDTSLWQPGNRAITGLNIFKAYADPGVQSSDLVNWAAIKMDAEGDWEFPQGGECRVTGEGRTFTQDTFCVGLTGTRQNQSVVIDGPKGRQPTVDAGVIALGRGTSNSIEVRNGNLHAILIEGAPGQTKEVRNDRVVLGDGEGGSGELIVGAITGVDSIEQDGGTWAYGVKGADDPNVPSALIDSGRRSEEDLDEMGLFPALSGYGTASVASVEIAGRDRKKRELQRAAFTSITGDQDQPLRVVNDGAELVVVEGIHGNASLASSGEAHLTGTSSYTGPTIVVSGGTLTAANTGALSPVSTTLIGREASIEVTGEQAVHRLLIRDQGSMMSTDPGSASSLVSQGIINLGDINLDSIQMEDGMTRFLDRVIERRGVQIPVDSPLRKIKAQGSLKNLGGSIDLTGDLTFESTGDAAGHALLNLSSREEEKLALIRANSIEFSDANDVLINTGVVETFGFQGIDFKGGNDLVLTKGTFDIAEGSLIDGGEALDTSLWQPGNRAITGLNIFKAYADPGVQSSDLVNWAAIKMDVDGDWEFPQGGECRVTGVGNSYSVDTLCVGLTGQKEDQFVRIDSGATLDAGVIALGRGTSNSIEVRNGNLHAILIEGAPGQTKEARNDRVVLGDGEGGSGELIVGAITGVDSIEQDGGTWAYGVKGAYDPKAKQILIESGRRSAEELDEMGLFPSLSGYGTASVASVEIAGRDRKKRELQRAAFTSITGDQDQPLRVVNDGAELVVVEGIHGNASLTTSGNTLLSGKSSYSGDTQIKADGELKAGNAKAFSRRSEITLDDGGVLNLDGHNNTIAGLLSGSKLQSNPGVVDLGEAGEATLSVGKGDFSGEIVGDGALRKFGDARLTLSGANTYTGSTTVENGVLALANGSGIPQASPTLVTGSGRLDLATNLIGRGEFQIDDLSITGGGQVFVRASQPLVSKNIVLHANDALVSDDVGGIAVALNGKNKPPIRVSKKFVYRSGSLVVAGPATDDPEGTWKIIDGKVKNPEALVKNTYLTVSSSNRASYAFGGLGEKNVVEGGAMYQGYLEKGSLNLVIEQKSEEDLSCDLNPDQGDCKDEGSKKPPVIPPFELPTCEGDDCEVGGELPKPKPLPGCEVGNDLCDIISDIPGDEDDALGQEEDLAGDVIDGLLDGLAEEEIDLPLSFDYGQLARLITSGLLPRNVDAPGRSMFNYNNLLVGTVFERLPLRQFKAVEVAEVVEEEAVILEPEAVVPAEPIRGLWSQAEGMDEQQAQEYLKQRVAQADQVVVEDVDFELDGIGYVEDPSLTGQYANRDGVRAWYKAFGGDTGPSKTSTLYGDYNASASGMVLGADVSLGSNVQIGVFGNYGDINLYQYSGDTGSGSWNPTGWGGGITADWWSKNFYVQGLISASSFSGNQKRNIIAINEQVGNETARGDKTVTSYSYALRLGAPFEAGRLLLEPQFTAAWTQNQESGFTENGADQLNLRYGSRTTNFLQTELGMKFALPIKSGERAEWVPNLRVAWLGDWNQNNEDQSIGYAFTDQTVGVDSLEENQIGVLIEGGLDYTMANINNGSWKLYVRGGAEVWGGERGTDWRASGGVTWQF